MAEKLSKADTLLVPSLANDESLVSLATTAARLQELDLSCLIIYDLENVTSPILPLLAEQFHIMGLEGWCFAETEQQKRELIRRSIEMHRHKGTPWAVERVIDALGFENFLQEWFEYGADPYLFRVDVNLYEQSWSEKTWDTVYGLIMEWKNARSHLDKLRIFQASKGTIYIGSATVLAETITVYPYFATEIIIDNRIPAIACGSQSIETMTIYPSEYLPYLKTDINFGGILSIQERITLK